MNGALEATLLRDLLAAALAVALGALAALLTAGPSWRRRIGLAVSCAGLAVPALAEPVIVRSILGLGEMLLFVRVVDLYRERHSRAALSRLWHAFSAVDTRRLKAAPRLIDARRWGGFIAWIALSALGIFGVLAAERLSSAAHWPARWLGGTIVIYGFVEALWALIGAAYASLGFSTPELHKLPLVSRSVQELWGQRWSLTVRHWLHVNVVRVWARHGPLGVGMLLAFVASGVAHGYVVLVAIGPSMAAVMLGFFALQGLLVLLERRLGVLRWAKAPAHAWVLGVMLLSSPLFTEPLLRCMGL